MSTSLAYHTQGIIGFQHQSYEFSGGVAIQRLIRKEFRCPRCFHSAVKTYPIRTRRILRSEDLPHPNSPDSGLAIWNENNIF